MAYSLSLIFVFLFYLSTAANACKTVVWLSRNPTDVIEKCWNLKDGNWYGGGTELQQKWPISAKYDNTPAIVGGLNGEMFNVLSRYWLNSKGYSIKVEDDVPLFIKSNENEICFVAKNDNPFPKLQPAPKLSYTLCGGSDNLTDLFLTNFENLFSLPKLPNEDIFKKSIWSTWPTLNEKVDKSSVENYGRDIYNFISSDVILNIAHNWESCLGELEFDTMNFGPVKDTVSKIKESRFLLALSVTPFISEKCEKTFIEAGMKGYLLKSGSGMPIKSQVLEQLVSSIDFTKNDEFSGTEWWLQRVENLKVKYGIDMFFFTHGQISWIVNLANMSSYQPEIYSENYLAAVTAKFDKNIVVSIGTPAQRIAAFVRMHPKQGEFSSLGIQSVIPTAFQMGLAGFPFIIPDVAGGSAGPTKPEKNLYIRWVELNTLMPVMHFSYGPFDFDDEVVTISKKMIELRKKFLQNIMDAARQSVVDGSPIIRPLWWIAPNDETAQKIDDQYLVGNDLMIAPVVKNQTQRTVYFPDGISWRDEVNGVQITTSGVQKFDVPLDTLLHFVRIN